MTYNSWPLGKLPIEKQRKEPDTIKGMGYLWDDPRDIIGMFENKVAEFAGAKYAVSTDCCSHAIFLCLKLLGLRIPITIPKRTYISIPMQIRHANCPIRYEDLEWSGMYQLKPFPIYDAAVRWQKGMYIPNTFMCLSFQIKKTIPIGRGGIILCDSKYAYDRLKLMSYDGRDLNTPYDSPDHIKCIGYHYYMTPEDAARGIILLDSNTKEGDSGNSTMYPDVSNIMQRI
jgi:hypothetical protein